MNTVLERTKFSIEAENYQEAIAILDNLDNEGYQEIPQDYFWLYGLALFAQDSLDQAQEIWLEGLLKNNYSEEAIAALIHHLTLYVHRQEKKPSLVSIQTIYQATLIIADLDENYYQSTYLPSLKVYFDRVKKEALSLATAKKETEAKPIYEILTFLFPDDAELFYQKGMIHYELKEYDEALEYCFKAISLNSINALYYYGLGLIFEKLDNCQLAANAYCQTLEYDSQNANAYVNLANLLIENDQVQEAITLYQQAIDNQVSHFGLYLNYGNLLLAQAKNLEAIEIYKKAIPLFHQYPDIYHNLAVALERIENIAEAEVNRGRALFYEGKDDEAFKIFERCRSLYYEDDWDYWNEISVYYIITNKYKILLEKTKQALYKFPDSIRQRVYLLACLMRFHYYNEATEFASVCISYFSEDPEKQFIFRLLHHSIIPIIYHSQEEIIATRKKYYNQLKFLVEETHFISNEAKPYILFALEIRGSHYLHFHGCNDIELQCLYGKLVTYLIQTYFPELIQPKKLSKVTERKIRVGYACVRSKGLGQLFLAWIKFRNINLFEIFFYDLGQDIDIKTEQFNILSDHYCHCPWDIEQVAKHIHQDKLDILVYLDAVVEPKLHTLSFFRLAPIQCATWGHPITTGSSQVDYFLGSDAMEPPNAQEHYSEQLVRLPNLGIYLQPVDVSNLTDQSVLTRNDLKLEEADIIYVSCQMLSKYLPQHDYLYPEIIRQVPKGKILFFNAYESDAITDIFKERLKNAFDKHQLCFEEYCLFIPRLPYPKYLNLLLFSDVFLDTLGWSGCITTFDIIACGLPIVTMPGELMRGRQTYGMLKIMGVEDSIAYTEADYIRLAVKLGINSTLREQVRQKILQNSHKLYYDRSCIDALERFYCDVVNFSGEEQSIALYHQD